VLADTNATYTPGLSEWRGSTSEFLHPDPLWTTRGITNSSQTVTGTINHDAFGLTVNTTGSSTNPYKFTATSGYRDDGDAGLVHVGARYYDPQVDRFITRDTELDQHPYLYCEHDPVNSTDPTGHYVGEAALRWGLPWAFRLAVVCIPAWAVVAIAVAVAVIAVAVYIYASSRPGSTLDASHGPPGGTQVEDRGNGEGTIRDFGPDGRARTDYDFGHDHGAGDPHAHDWDWGKPRARGPGRGIRPGE
jgi:RHS repeat-associated protein